MLKDYYKILEIDKSATKQQIREAYLKLTRSYHPSRNNSSNPEERKKNTQRFQDIAEAYSVLYDDKKRATYDSGIDPEEQNFGFNDMNQGSSSFDFSDFFDLFGSQKRTRTYTRESKQDLRITLDDYFTLEDLYNNKEIKITYQRNKPCDKCSGSGASYKCSACHGQGVRQNLSGIFISVTTCSACNGQGYQVCKTCAGKGTRLHNETLSIKIPGFAMHEKPIKIPKMGGYGQGDYGDLYVLLRIREHKFFTYLENGNLSILVPITSLQAMIGDILRIPTIKKKYVELPIPPNTQNNTIFTLTGYGMEKQNGIKADLIVKIYVEMPKLTRDEIINKVNLWNIPISQYIKVSQFQHDIDEYIKKL